MNKKIYLHIGLEKTGTTAIQNVLKANKELLLNNYNLYCPKIADFDTIVTHHKFAKFFLQKDIAKHHIKLSNIQIKELLYEFQHHNTANSLIISSELFSYLKSDEISYLCTYLKDKNFDVKIILFLRRQDDYVESKYGQHIKNAIGIGRVIIDKSKFSVPNLNFYEFITKWQTSGFENIIIRVYERKKNFIYDSFFSVFDQNISLNELNIPEEIINPSLSPLHQELMLKHVGKIKNTKKRIKISKIIYYHNRAYYSTNPQHFMKKNLYTADEKKSIYLKYKESNHKLLGQFFPNSSKSALFSDNGSTKEKNITGIDYLSKQQIISIFFSLLAYLVRNANLLLDNKLDQ